MSGRDEYGRVHRLLRREWWAAWRVASALFMVKWFVLAVMCVVVGADRAAAVMALVAAFWLVMLAVAMTKLKGRSCP